MKPLGSDVKMNDVQKDALRALCARFHVEFIESDFRPAFDLPEGYLAGWVGSIYVGCSPEGEISS